MNIPMSLFPVLFASAAWAAAPAARATPQPAKPELSEQQKVLYAVGIALGQSVADFGLKPEEVPYVVQGFQDYVAGRKPKVSMSEYGPKIEALVKERRAAVSKSFLDKAAAEKGAKRLPSGLVIKVLKPGEGPSPKATDTVKVNYRGTLTDGREFDSSYRRGQPAEFPLDHVIPCWTEGVQLMHVGEKAQLVCPSDIAYGQRGAPPDIPPGATLVFEIELLGIK